MMEHSRPAFATYREISLETRKVNGIGGVEVKALGIGTVGVTSAVNGEEFNGELREVLHVPGIGVSLFSIGSATAPGVDVLFLRYQGLSFQGPNNSHGRTKNW